MMLTAAFGILSAAVLLGAALAVLFMRGPAAPRAPWPVAALHGLLGLTGLCCLALSLRGPPRGAEFGVASFGAISTVLIALAALVGLGVFFTYRLKGRRAGGLIALHATLAISGFVILAAYLMA
jgi:hypothetical protein